MTLSRHRAARPARTADRGRGAGRGGLVLTVAALAAVLAGVLVGEAVVDSSPPDSGPAAAGCAADGPGCPPPPAVPQRAVARPAPPLPSIEVAADGYVDGDSPRTSFAGKDHLYADAVPTRIGYLTFAVSGVPATPVTLRLTAVSAGASGLAVSRVADPGWTEESLTYAGRPELGAEVGRTGPFAAGSRVELDVTAVVTGPGTYGFAVTTTDDTAVKIASREGGAPPVLTFGAAVAPDSVVISPAGDGYAARSDLGQVHIGPLKAVGERAVVDLLAGGGGTIAFTAGTFDLGPDFFRLVNVRDVVFAGAGRDLTFLRNSSAADADTEPFNFTGAERVTIRDLTVHAGGPPRSTSDAIDFDRGNASVVENVRITGSRGRGIVFDGKDRGATADGNVVRDCEIAGTSSHGIELIAASGNRVERCSVSAAGGAGIAVSKASTRADQPNKPSSGNTIADNVVDEAGRDGIAVTSGDRNHIVGNRVTNSSDDVRGRDGIRIQSADGVGCDDNLVAHNLVTDTQVARTQRYGLNIDGVECRRTVVGPGNDVAGNVVERDGGVRDGGVATVFR